MKKILGFVVIAIMIGVIGVYAQFGSKGEDKVIAIFDGKEIKMLELNNYVNTLLGEKYKKMLESKEGIKQLADYYITRQIVLSYAKETIGNDDKIVANHQQRNMDKETMLISAVLQKEVQNKVVISNEELENFMKNTNITDKIAAYSRLESQKRADIYKKFIDELKSKHSIKIL